MYKQFDLIMPLRNYQIILPQTEILKWLALNSNFDLVFCSQNNNSVLVYLLAKQFRASIFEAKEDLSIESNSRIQIRAKTFLEINHLDAVNAFRAMFLCEKLPIARQADCSMRVKRKKKPCSREAPCVLIDNYGLCE